MVRSQVEDVGKASNMEGSYKYILISSHGQPTRGGSPAWGWGEV